MGFENNNHILEPFLFDITEVSDNMSNSEYHSRNEFSSSFLKTINSHSVGRALAPFKFEGPALIFGDAYHEKMELKHLSDRFVVKPEAGVMRDYNEEFDSKKKDVNEGDKVQSTAHDGRTKEGKLWIKENDHRIILTNDDITNIDGMYESTMNVPFVKKLMESPNLERRDEWSFFAQGDDNTTRGLKFRVRPDVHFVTKDEGKIAYILDWKSTVDIRKLIRWSFKDLGYDIQAVFYSDMLGVNPRNFLFVCVEKEPPYSARILRLSDESIDEARFKIAKVIGRVKDWKADPSKNDIELNEIIEL